MADVPRLYVPIYILIRIPLLTLFGAALAILSALLPRLAAGSTATAAQGYRAGRADGDFSPGLPGDLPRPGLHRIAPFPVRGPRAGGARRHRSRRGADALATRGRLVASGGLAVVDRGVLWDAVTLVRLHPYEYLFYNPAVGGLAGASRRYDLDYWFGSMPEAVDQLEAYFRRTEPVCNGHAAGLFGCGLRRTSLVREDRHAPATALGLQAGVEPVRVLHRADPYELRPRSRRQDYRHGRAARRRHRLRQGPAGVDPPDSNRGTLTWGQLRALLKSSSSMIQRSA